MSRNLPRFSSWFSLRNPQRFAGNVLVSLAFLLIIAWGIDWAWSSIMGISPVWCFAVAWLSTMGIGGSLSLILGVAGIIILILGKRKSKGVLFLLTAFGIAYMPYFLDGYLGIGKTCQF